MARLRTHAARGARAARLLYRDDRVPRPLRWLVAVALLPLPGPLDEAVLLLLVPIFLAFYREPARDAWAKAR